MATMNPILRLRQAFRSMGALRPSERMKPPTRLTTIPTAVDESDLSFMHQMMTEVRQ